MIKYFVIVIFLLSSFSVYADDAKKEKMKPQIGSIEDSGMVNPDEFIFSNAENKFSMPLLV